MSLADRAHAEQQAVENGSEGCPATHPDGDLDIKCVRVAHSDESTHVGWHGDTLVQWEDR